MSLFPTPAVSAFADVVIALLDNADEWSLCSGGYALEHPSGLRIWVCNGFWFCKICSPGQVLFGWKKVPVWLACKRAMRKLRAKRDAERLAKASEALLNMRDNVVAFRRNAR